MAASRYTSSRVPTVRGLCQWSARQKAGVGALCRSSQKLHHVCRVAAEVALAWTAVGEARTAEPPSVRGFGEQHRRFAMRARLGCPDRVNAHGQGPSVDERHAELLGLG